MRGPLKMNPTTQALKPPFLWQRPVLGTALKSVVPRIPALIRSVNGSLTRWKIQSFLIPGVADMVSLAANEPVNKGAMNVSIIDRNAGNPPENAAIKTIAILQQLSQDELAAPRIAYFRRIESHWVLTVNPALNLAW
jgi:hypothetical protein